MRREIQVRLELVREYQGRNLNLRRDCETEGGHLFQILELASDAESSGLRSLTECRFWKFELKRRLLNRGRALEGGARPRRR